MGDFRWSVKREQAALLLAEDHLSNTQIATKVGVSRKTVDSWYAEPEFRVRVDDNVEQYRRAMLAAGIQARSCRLAAVEDRWRRLVGVMDARAKEMEDVPGGSSGLLMRQIKMIKVYSAEKNGDMAEIGEGLNPTRRAVLVQEYTLDTTLLRELRDLEKQAAEESGESHEKTQPCLTLVRKYIGVDVENV